MNTKRFILTAINFIIFLLYFTILGIVAPFLFSVTLKNGGIKTWSSTNDIYKMVDNYYDPEEFFDFRADYENINKLASFYNELKKSNNFKVLTAFDQAIFVNDFKGDSRFYYNSEEFINNSINSGINLKSIQLNKEMYDFYNIEVESGSNIHWEEISYQRNVIPILLGADYKNLFHQGDIINGNYYSKDINFEVIGFLKENSSIKYANLKKFNLDTYILIPYPPKLWSVKKDFQFESILYFAMINCDIFPNVDEVTLLKEIKEIANKTGFTNFSIIGIDNFQIRNIQLLSDIKEHQNIVVSILIGISIFDIVVGMKIFCLTLKLYSDLYFGHKKHWKKRYRNIYVQCVGIPLAGACILGDIFSLYFLEKLLFITVLVTCLSLLLIYMFIFFIGKYVVKQISKKI